MALRPASLTLQHMQPLPRVRKSIVSLSFDVLGEEVVGCEMLIARRSMVVEGPNS